MRRLGVAPELIVGGAGNEWESTVPRFLILLRAECRSFRASIPLHCGCFPRSHAFVVRCLAQPAERASSHD